MQATAALLFICLVFHSFMLAASQIVQWTRLAGSTSSYSYAEAAAVDSSQSVYVAGYSPASLHGEPFAGSYDLVVLKYSSNGTRVWTRMAGSSADDRLYGIAWSNDFVYACGYVGNSIHDQTSVGDKDIVILKYSTNGTRIWTRIVGSAQIDDARAIAVDGNSNSLYLTGFTTGTTFLGASGAGGSDIFVMKYSTNGSFIWSKRIGSSEFDYGYGVTVDNVGAVYVVGNFGAAIDGQSLAGGADLLLMKYSANGTRIWSRLWGTSVDDYFYDVAYDSASSSVYSIGYAQGSVHGEPHQGNEVDELIIVRVHTNGTRIWTRMLGSTGTDTYGYGIAADGAGGIYAFGMCGGSINGQPYVGGSFDALLVKYSTNGTRIWTKIFGTTGYDGGFGVAASAVDSTAYVVGATAGSLNGEALTGLNDMYVVKYTGPTMMPTIAPTFQPSPQPTAQPSSQPTRQPTSQPSLPSCQPSSRPSSQPSSQPLSRPSSQPTGQPTGWPTSAPSVQPTMQPSAQPTLQPSGQPSVQPIATPTGQPTGEPSGSPSSQPSRQPSARPSRQPSDQPSSRPSTQPTGSPTSQPSASPTSVPNSCPSGQPSGVPSSLPSTQPSGQPSVQPTIQPSGEPSSSPSIAPDKTICQYRTYIQEGTGAEFTNYRCLRVPGNYVGDTFRRRTLSSSSSVETPSTPHVAFLSPRDFDCSVFSLPSHPHHRVPAAESSCRFQACRGDKVKVSLQSEDGGFCKGQVLIELITTARSPLDLSLGIGQISSAGSVDSCPKLEYHFSGLSSCQEIVVARRCQGDSSCSGRAVVRYLP